MQVMLRVSLSMEDDLLLYIILMLDEALQEQEDQQIPSLRWGPLGMNPTLHREVEAERLQDQTLVIARQALCPVV